MSEKSLKIFGNICISCVVTGLIVLAVVSGATLQWVMNLQ